MAPMPNPCLPDRTLIESILPHREPFLFVDKIIAFSVAETIAAELFLAPERPFFKGHFPGRPVMPGVLTIEALAQTSGLLLGLTWREQGREAQESGLLFLGKVQVKFTASARAGELLVLESRLKKSFAGLFLFDVVARTGDRAIAGGELTLARESEEQRAESREQRAKSREQPCFGLRRRVAVFKARTRHTRAPALVCAFQRMLISES